jgi:hypothetical protein
MKVDLNSFTTFVSSNWDKCKDNLVSLKEKSGLSKLSFSSITNAFATAAGASPSDLDIEAKQLQSPSDNGAYKVFCKIFPCLPLPADKIDPELVHRFETEKSMKNIPKDQWLVLLNHYKEYAANQELSMAYIKKEGVIPLIPPFMSEAILQHYKDQVQFITDQIFLDTFPEFATNLEAK